MNVSVQRCVRLLFSEYSALLLRLIYAGKFFTHGVYGWKSSFLSFRFLF